MSKRMKVSLIYGGKSSEHEVSLVSAASILAAFDAARYELTPIGMDKQGRCFLNNAAELRLIQGPLPVVTETSIPLESLLKDGTFAVETDVVFPMVHGPLYEDGCLQGLLELAGVAYVGSGVLGSAIGMDKDVQRQLASFDGISSTRYRRLSWREIHTNLDEYCQKIVAEFGWPIFVKPCTLGSSVGIHKVHHMTALKDAISDARRYDDHLLIEAFASGREIELAVLENSNVNASPKVSIPGEICVEHPDGFYSYAAKYLESELTRLEIPAQLDEKLVLRLQKMAADIFTRLRCHGMARIDFFVNDKTDEILFNEVNTLPGFTPISMYPKLWQASGLSYSDLLDNLIELAMVHRQHKNQFVTHYL
jgi:D-alanine-D-alanine ligase